MQPNQTTLFKLGYLGLLPFFGGVALVVTDNTLFDLTGYQIFTTYSAIILSFLSGVLWGAAIEPLTHPFSRKALIFSNVFALMAWAALLLGRQQHILTTLLLIVGFLSVWFAEKQIRNIQPQDMLSGYQTLRNRLTAGVVIMHVIVLFL